MSGILYLYSFKFYVCVSVFRHVHEIADTHIGQKKIPNPLELELQAIAVNCPTWMLETNISFTHLTAESSFQPHISVNLKINLLPICGMIIRKPVMMEIKKKN